MNTPNNKRRRESQRKMENAFVSLLQDREIGKVRVTDVCKLAGVNRTTFYANYQDVFALADAVLKRLEEDVLALYPLERAQHRSSHDFLPLFHHIRDNQLFYKTYFKLNKDGYRHSFGYDTHEAFAFYGMQHIDYHIEFFGAGLNAVIRKWLNGGCKETPEEINAIIEAEYKNRRYVLKET